MDKALLMKNNIFENYHFLGDLGPNNHIWSLGISGPQKNGFGHILVKNYHVIVIEGLLEAYG